MANQNDIQQRFFEILAVLTKSGKVEWARSTSEPGFAYCFVSDELIVFEISGRDGKLVDPKENVVGIRSKCRNVSYIWLQPTPGFTDLLKLLKETPIDDDAFIEFRRRGHLAPIRILETLL